MLLNFFYEVEKLVVLKLGNDPEMGNEQILTDLAFFGEKNYKMNIKVGCTICFMQ